MSIQVQNGKYLNTNEIKKIIADEEKNNNSKEILKQISNARKENNKNWMKILQLALESAPIKSKKVLKNINSQDKKISKLVEKLSKE